MKIYYNNKTGEILSEEEAQEEILVEIEKEKLYLKCLSSTPMTKLWEMLSEKDKLKFYNEAKEWCLGEYTIRDFD